jgi:hypothetical protein
MDTIHSCVHASVLKLIKEFFQTNRIDSSEVKQCYDLKRTEVRKRFCFGVLVYSDPDCNISHIRFSPRGSCWDAYSQSRKMLLNTFQF